MEEQYEARQAQIEDAHHDMQVQLVKSTCAMLLTERVRAEAHHTAFQCQYRGTLSADAEFQTAAIKEQELEAIKREAELQNQFVDKLLDRLDASMEEKATLQMHVDDLQRRLASLET